MAISLRYRECLQGFVGVRERNLWRGASVGRSAGSTFATDLVCCIDDWEAFVTGPEHCAEVHGTATGPCIGGARDVRTGIFVLRRPSPTSWHSRCTMECLDADHAPVTIVCVRHVDDNDPAHRGRQATLTYVRLFEGEVDSAERTGVVRASGILQTTVDRQLKEIGECLPQGGTTQEQVKAAAEFRMLMSCLSGSG